MEYYVLSPLTFVLRIAEVFSQFLFVLVLLKEHFKLSKVLSSSVVFSIAFEIVKSHTPQYLTGIIAAFFAILILHFILEINWIKSILAYLITIILVAIIDCVISLFIVKICSLSTFIELSQNSKLSTIGKVAIIVITFLISIFFKIINQQARNTSIEKVKSSLSLATIAVTFCLLIPNFAIILYYHDSEALPLAVILINILAIIAMFFISIFNTQRGIKLIQAEEELITEKTYNKTLQDLVDSLRTFKHDYNNTLQTMHGYIFTNDMDGLKKYFDQVLEEAKAITALDKLNPELFRNPSLLVLVTAKFEYARINGVTVNFEIYADLDELNIKTYDFTRVLGIFLDNAIEAAIGSDKKLVNFYVVEKENKVRIEISNSFSESSLRIEDIYLKGASSKGENRGLGLYKAKDILSKYPNLVHETSSKNGMFLQKLVIDKVKLPIS